MNLQGNRVDAWGQQVQEKADTRRKAAGFKEVEGTGLALKVGGLAWQAGAPPSG